MSTIPDIRTGLGFDVHQLVACSDGESGIIIGGVRIPHHMRCKGHSDADPALHALTDALLGAVSEGDIGTHFPPSDPQWKGKDSTHFLKHAQDIVVQKNGIISNVDLVIMCEAPKILPHREAMKKHISEALNIDASRVSVKATTTEKLGFTGRGEGIAAQAIATVVIL
ncbi:MAG: 2-C-methyl-D-erythritol 2,4-cyclodiphosphate synthase [Alphaproteobacteria bacterium]|nr:2-C-methyl-D-erythritol 2,4-cyclodiphosphate synthase [Alphaproteobacteria bacterium]MCL2504656.1 2-C-methyl-D-erythritol 2,4-cyclodiphosphate synthase [Alphaproteobacteria bacterium]